VVKSGMGEDDDETTMSSPISVRVDPSREIDAVLTELEDLLKNGDVIGVLSERGVNASLAFAVIDGLRAYLEGDKQKASDDLGMIAEEIAGRLGAKDIVVDTNGNGRT